MRTLLDVELRKLSGSLALLLAIVAPLLPGLLVALALIVSRQPPTWILIFQRFTLPLWGMFLFPMTMAAFAILLAQVEYRTNAWEHLLALPLRKWQIFLSKALLVFGLAALMTFGVILLSWAGGALGGAIKGRFPTGSIPWLDLFRTATHFLAGAMMLVVIQLWAALRFANFVIPLAIGICGTLVGLAVTMTGTSEADWFPWVLPAKILARSQAGPLPFLAIACGLVLLAAMITDLSRRSFR